MNLAILGAGLIGRLAAVQLSRLGYQITLFDKDNKDGQQSAAYAAAGLLTPLGESLHCQPNIVAMGFESLKKWPLLLEQIDHYTYFQQQGSLVLSHEADISDYHHFYRHLQRNYPQHQSKQLDSQQLRQLEPELSRSFNRGLYLPDEGQIGNRKLMVALKNELKESPVKWLSQTLVDKVQVFESGCAISANQQQLNFDLVIDCRGVGARQQLAKSGQSLRAVRGELFQLFAPEVNISRPIRLMHPRYQLYVAPKTKGFYVVGATEIESDDNGPMTVRSAMELLSAAYSVHPGFAEAQIRQQVSQCRPAFDNNQPKIISQNNLIQVNGLYRHGFLIAPVVLEHLISLVSAKVQGDNSQFINQLAHPELFTFNEAQYEYHH